MPLGLNIGKCTLLGNYRENNEDAIEVKQFPDMLIGIVAGALINTTERNTSGRTSAHHAATDAPKSCPATKATLR